MTVSELISELQELNKPDAELVVLYDGGYAACGVGHVWFETEEDERSGRWESGDVILRTDQ